MIDNHVLLTSNSQTYRHTPFLFNTSRHQNALLHYFSEIIFYEECQYVMY